MRGKSMRAIVIAVALSLLLVASAQAEWSYWLYSNSTDVPVS